MTGQGLTRNTRLYLRTKSWHYVLEEFFAMTPGEKTFKRTAGEGQRPQSEDALALAKIQARAELRQIFDEEIMQRASERQQPISRPATASHS